MRTPVEPGGDDASARSAYLPRRVVLGASTLVYLAALPTDYRISIWAQGKASSGGCGGQVPALDFHLAILSSLAFVLAALTCEGAWVLVHRRDHARLLNASIGVTATLALLSAMLGLVVTWQLRRYGVCG